MVFNESIVAWLFLGVSLIGAAFTLNAFIPVRRVPFLVPSFVSSWLTAELAVHNLIWQAMLALAFIYFGGLSSWPGMLAMGITLVSWLGLLRLFWDGRRAHLAFDEALEGLEEPAVAYRLPISQLILPFRLRRKGVKVTRDVLFREIAGRRLRLDVAMPKEPGKGRPAIIQIHGGAWIIGDKREQGWPLIGHLAANGWVCFNVNYRLSPGATWPDHLVDLKFALAWIRERSDEYGIDPNFIAVTGGSAGGHLTAMMALTANQPEYQPGFESADTSLQAAVPVYGVYDFTNRAQNMPERFRKQMLQPLIMKAFFDEEPEKFRSASPMDRVHEAAPPFFVIHGDRDTLAPVEDARLFVEKLRTVSAAPVRYAELRGAQHAFDVFVSPRTAAMLNGTLRFLTAARDEATESTEVQSSYTSSMGIVTSPPS